MEAVPAAGSTGASPIVRAVAADDDGTVAIICSFSPASDAPGSVFCA